MKGIRYPEADGLRRQTILLAALCAVCCACEGLLAQEPPDPVKRRGTRSELLLKRLDDRPGLHRLLRVSERILTGAEPQGEEAFRQLAAMGVRTVVCVDSSTPKADLARRYGLRYVHIPIGYDQISPSASAAMTHLMRTIEGDVYVHCHHGRQRGPSMAAIGAIADGAATPNQAVGVLSAAGTSRVYAGLWRDIRRYKAPPSSSKPPSLPESAGVTETADTMAELDRHWDRLERIRDNHWKPLPDHPELDASLLARRIEESLSRSASRTKQNDKAYATWARQSVQLGKSLRTSVDRQSFATAAKRMKELKSACSQCHEKHRNH